MCSLRCYFPAHDSTSNPLARPPEKTPAKRRQVLRRIVIWVTALFALAIFACSLMMGLAHSSQGFGG